MNRFLSFLFLVLFGTSLPLFAADTSSDDLFTNPEPDTPADTTQTVSLDAFSGQSLRFFETLSVDGYYVVGYKQNGQFADSPVNALNFGFGSDIRLDRTARAYASFALQYPTSSSSDSNLYNPYEPPVDITTPSDLVFTNIKVKELFLDYSLGTLAIVRLGRQSATWGQGRLFNPGNLVTGISDGMAAKISTALGPVAVTGVAIKNDSQYNLDSSDTKTAFALASLGSAVSADYSTEWFSVGSSAFYHYQVGTKVDSYLKTSLWGADLFAEGLGEWGLHGQNTWTGIAGLYRDFGDRSKWLKLQAEALLSGRGDDGTFQKVTAEHLGFSDWTLGVAATTEAFGFLATKPSVMWLHSFADNSGQVVVGFVNNALPHISLTLGFARVYGADDSRYIKNNPDSQDRVWSATLKASFSFEIKN